MFEPLTNHLLIGSLLTLVGVAVLTDVHDRRIPNLLVVIGLLVGLAGHTWLSGAGGLVTAASGACAGLLCLLPFYISGGMGAGDVKLMAMSGAFLGPFHVGVAAIASLVVGGVLGVGWFFWQFSTSENDEIEDAHAIPNPVPAGSRAGRISAIPYALAIGAGVLVSLKAAPAILLALGKGI